MSGQTELLEEVENVLTSFLPSYLQVFLSNYYSQQKDAFSTAIREIERFLYLEKASNRLDTNSSMSPLEEITFLPNIVDSILKEVSEGKAIFLCASYIKVFDVLLCRDIQILFHLIAD